MSPGQPASPSGSSKRHRRSRSVNATQEPIIDLTGETSSSRKHDLHEKDSQGEGPSKRPKLKGGSEPPMCKDTTIAPQAKRNKSRKKIDHHKATRTSNHQHLKDRVKTLESELDSARQAHEDESREQQENLDWHAEELKLLQARWDEQAQVMGQQQQTIETERQKNQTLRRKLEDTANDVGALQLSCQNKDEELKGKEKVISAKQRELDDSKHRTTSFEEALAETELALKGKDETITTLRKELDDSKRQSESREKSLGIAKLAVKGKDEVINALQKDLDDSKHKSASLEKYVAEMRLELKRKDETITANQEELDTNRHKFSTLEEALLERDRALKAAKRDQSDFRKQLALRDEKLSSTERELDEAKEGLEKAAKREDALYLINEENGHRNYLIVQREENAKEKLKSTRAENKTQAVKLGREKDELQKKCKDLQTDLEAQEDERNRAVGSLQSKLHATRQRYSYKVSDEKIKEDFDNLESNIRQFVDNYTQPVLNVTDQELNIVWPDWSPELRKCLASPLLYNLVFEAYIWEYLLARLFGENSQVWAGDLGRSLEETLRMAADGTLQAGFKSDDYIDFHYLRSSSSSLIGRLNGADFLPKYFDADCEAITSTLTNLCGLQNIKGSMWPDAMGIFKDAREFAIQLRKLKAEYTLRMHQPCPVKDRLRHGFNFVSETMADLSPNRGGKSPGQALSVDFIVHPGVYKRGNNNGANYEVKTCLIKMGVACNAPELFLKSGPSTSSRSSSKPAQNAPRSGETKQTKEGKMPSSTVNKAKKGSPISNPVRPKDEQTHSQQSVDQSSTPGLTLGSPERKARDAAQMRSGLERNAKILSRELSKLESNSTKSTTKHPMGPARGRGGGHSAKRTRHSKGSDPDPDYHPKSNI